MTVKAVMKHYSMASDGKVKIVVDSEEYTFAKQAVNELIEADAPILMRTFGLIMVKDGDLIITAY